MCPLLSSSVVGLEIAALAVEDRQAALRPRSEPGWSQAERFECAPGVAHVTPTCSLKRTDLVRF
jgi:hypothetical protein